MSTDIIKYDNFDKDLMILDDIVDTIPVRDWTSIVELFNSNENNKKFPIPPVICSKIIQRIQDGNIPKLIFQEYGINYTNFNNKYKKIKLVLEEIYSMSQITEKEQAVIQMCKENPIFILGQDIQRAVAYNFNISLSELKELSIEKPQDLKEFMKIIHPDEFNTSEEKKELSVVIKIGKELMEAI